MTVGGEDEATLDSAWGIASIFLRTGTGPVNATRVMEVSIQVHAALTAAGLPHVPGVDAIRRKVESMVTIEQDAPIMLDGRRPHEQWLDQARTEREWRFWPRYEQHLLTAENLPDRVVRRLDESTWQILGRMHDPTRPGPWRTTGLVVGEVQSGKTANFVGLICKAADAGFPLIVVLAGTLNSLRSQTQLRLDLGFLGIDTQFLQRPDQLATSRRIGVGTTGKRLDAQPLTTSAENGDFKKAFADRLISNIGSTAPTILVVKKHVSILQNLRTWITANEGSDRPVGNATRRIVTGFPLLILDDEADQASINTKADPTDDQETDPTRTNGEIRQLLNSFDRAVYVGYTATPFANLYTDNHAQGDLYGPDLFPEDFMLTLRAPSNHFGPTRVFGLRSQDGDDVAPLPIYREVDDTATWLPPRHRKDVQPGDIPASLHRALDSFILTCAVRRLRGATRQHNSMLIHATHYQAVQNLIGEQIADEIYRRRNAATAELRRPDADVWTPLKALWNTDYVNTTAKFAALDPSTTPTRPDWEDVRSQIPEVLLRMTHRVMNGTSADALDYWERRDQGLTVVAIGGNKLSRGLTLDGLSVSYYLRTSQTYDTLLQMGRWFGYRPGYEDLCRLYTTPDLFAAYREITAASEELRLLLEEMAAEGATPENFGLGVRTSPNGLLVTAANKMRRATTVRLTFSGTGPETTVFDLRDSALRTNRDAVETLIGNIAHSGLRPEPRTPPNEPLRWRAVPTELVTTFLRAYRSDPMAPRVNPRHIADYIDRCRRVGELGTFNVVLASVRGEARPITLAGHEMRPVVRTGTTGFPGRYTIKAVSSPTDEYFGIPSEVAEQIRTDTSRRRGRTPHSTSSAPPGGTATAGAAGAPAGQPATDQIPTDQQNPVYLGKLIRRARDRNQPLLIIYPIATTTPSKQTVPSVAATPGPLVFGFKFSFPISSLSADDLPEMRVNQVWLDMEKEDHVDAD